MADFGAPVAQNVDVSPNRGIQTLSNLIGIQQQKQALQTGVYLQQAAQAQAQQEQQTAGQRAGIAQFWKDYDPQKHIGPDGTTDLNSFFSDADLRAKAGDAFPMVAKQAIEMKQSQLLAQKSLLDLDTDARTTMQAALSALRTDPDVINDAPGNTAGRQKIQQFLDDYASAGPAQKRAVDNYGARIMSVPAEKGRLAQTLSNVQLQAQAAGAQAEAQAQRYVPAGNRLINVAPQSVGGSQFLTGSPAIQTGQTPQVVTDQFGNLIPYAGTPGGIVGQAPQGGGQPAGQAPQAAPPRTAAPQGQTSQTSGQSGQLPYFAPGTKDITAYQTQRYNEVNARADQAKNNINLADKIIDLAPETVTGKMGAGMLAQVKTALGQVDGFNEAATGAQKYNTLVKTMHQLALTAWGSTGGTGTNQQLSTIESAFPNENMDPRTIASMAKFIKAGEMSNMAKADAQNNWLQQQGKEGMVNRQKFESEWRHNVDPMIFQLKTDPEMVTQQLNKLPPDQRQQKLNQIRDGQKWLRSVGAYD